MLQLWSVTWVDKILQAWCDKSKELSLSEKKLTETIEQEIAIRKDHLTQQFSLQIKQRDQQITELKA
jgi:hypothetical protein